MVLSQDGFVPAHEGVVMKPVQGLLLAAITISALGCDPKHSSNYPQGNLVTMQNQDIAVDVYENGGRRLRATDATGRIIINGELLDRRSEIHRSKGFVAFTKKASGRRLRTFNYRGEELPTSAVPLSRDSEVYISDYLIGFTTIDRTFTRLYVFTVDGIPVNTADIQLARDPEIFVENGALFFQAQGNRLMMVSTTGQVTLAAPHLASRSRNRRR